MATHRWRFSSSELVQSPSFRAGVAPALETEYRRTMGRLLRAAGPKLNLTEETTACASVFYQRFFAYQSLNAYDRSIVAMTALFLAAKVHEQARKARDVLNVFHSISAEASGGTVSSPMPVDREFWRKRDALVEHEQFLLRTLAFEVEVVLPHRYLANYLRSLGCSTELVRAAWQQMGDSFETEVCMTHRAEAVACAALWIAARLLEERPGEQWWRAFGVEWAELEGAVARLLERAGAVAEVELRERLLPSAAGAAAGGASAEKRQKLAEPPSDPASRLSSPPSLARSASASPLPPQ